MAHVCVDERPNVLIMVRIGGARGELSVRQVPSKWHQVEGVSGTKLGVVHHCRVETRKERNLALLVRFSRLAQHSLKQVLGIRTQSPALVKEPVVAKLFSAFL